jgi:hypothetical protein
MEVRTNRRFASTLTVLNIKNKKMSMVSHFLYITPASAATISGGFFASQKK